MLDRAATNSSLLKNDDESSSPESQASSIFTTDGGLSGTPCPGVSPPSSSIVPMSGSIVVESLESGSSGMSWYKCFKMKRAVSGSCQYDLILKKKFTVSQNHAQQLFQSKTQSRKPWIHGTVACF